MLYHEKDCSLEQIFGGDFFVLPGVDSVLYEGFEI